VESTPSRSSLIEKSPYLTIGEKKLIKIFNQAFLDELDRALYFTAKLYTQAGNPAQAKKLRQLRNDVCMIERQLDGERVSGQHDD
jgi:hypothetical protein